MACRIRLYVPQRHTEPDIASSISGSVGCAVHGHTLDALGHLAYAYLKEGKYSQAEQLSREIVDTKIRVYGADNINVLSDMEEVAITYRRQGRYPEASRLFHAAIGIAEKHQDPVVKAVW